MINRQHVLPVSVGKPPKHPQAPPSKEELTAILRHEGLSLQIGDSLKGGTISQVYAATNTGHDRLIVKYTCDFVDPDPAGIVLSHKEHYVDTRLLQFLAHHSKVKVPEVVLALADTPLTVMRDLRSEGFSLVADSLLAHKLPLAAAANIGRDLALLQQALGEHEEFETIESPFEAFYERGFELRQVYPNDQFWYGELEKRFTTANQQLIAVDTHPKNAFLDANQNTAWIDFGRSSWGDRDFALPNFLAHIAIYALAGYYSSRIAAEFIKRAVASYRTVLPIKDDSVCMYLAAEVLHRWAGKWIGGIDRQDQKLALLRFGMNVFDHKLFSISEIASELAKLGPTN